MLSRLLHTNERYFQQVLEVLLLASEVIELTCKLCCQNASSQIQHLVVEKLGYRKQQGLSELVRLYISGELSEDESKKVMTFLVEITTNVYYLPNEIDRSDRRSLLHEIVIQLRHKLEEKTTREAMKWLYDGWLLKDVFQRVQNEYRKQTTDIRRVNNVSLLVRQPNLTAEPGGKPIEDSDQ